MPSAVAPLQRIAELHGRELKTEGESFGFYGRVASIPTIMYTDRNCDKVNELS